MCLSIIPWFLFDFSCLFDEHHTRQRLDVCIALCYQFQHSPQKFGYVLFRLDFPFTVPYNGPPKNRSMVKRTWPKVLWVTAYHGVTNVVYGEWLRLPDTADQPAPYMHTVDILFKFSYLIMGICQSPSVWRQPGRV